MLLLVKKKEAEPNATMIASIILKKNSATPKEEEEERAKEREKNEKRRKIKRAHSMGQHSDRDELPLVRAPVNVDECQSPRDVFECVGLTTCRLARGKKASLQPFARVYLVCYSARIVGINYVGRC